MHNWDWAIHYRGASRQQPGRSRAVLTASPAAAVRGRRRAAAAAPPRRDKRGLHIAGRAQPAQWPAVQRQPAEAGGLADRRVGYHRHRRPTADTADSPAEEDRPGAADRAGQAGGTAPKARRPTLRGRSGAPRGHQPCGKPFPPPPTPPAIDRSDQPPTKHTPDHRGKKMTTLLINLAGWTPPRFNDLGEFR